MLMSALLSPTACAERVIDELLAANYNHPDRSTMVKLVRQLIRDQYEHCAQIAECYVPENDLLEDRSGMEVGDLIAEAFRLLADERAGRLPLIEEAMGSMAERQTQQA